LPIKATIVLNFGDFKKCKLKEIQKITTIQNKGKYTNINNYSDYKYYD